ncbi:hypothetical protein JXA48_04785 [Candidatus Woesearchaeota archaeon]|nr:hypothetical protein [Candidatus Woesearchaeota archaeon]
MVSSVNAYEVMFESNTYEIISLINNNSCENTTTVFKITNLNYSTGDNSTTIKYIQAWNNQTKNINKEIKKYTQTNTGEINNIESKENSLRFLINNQTLEWSIKSNCSKNNFSEFNATSQTINKTEINTSINNKTEEKNESEENTTQQNNNREKTIININKKFFLVGEKLEFNFINNTKPITYWIEDSKGTMVKEKYTTTNDNQKTYTFKEQDESDKIYFLIAKTDEEEKTVMLGVTDTVNKNQESIIKINEVGYDDEKINLEIEIYRGTTKKTTTYCYTQTDNKKSSDEIKIKINNQDEGIVLTTTIQPKNKWKNKTTIICEGLDKQDKIEINTIQKEEINKEEKENNKENKLEKEEDKKEEKQVKKTINTSSIIEEKEIQITGKTSAYSTNLKKEKTTTVIILTALISMFFGRLISYGPKQLIDKFIKK